MAWTSLDGQPNQPEGSWEQERQLGCFSEVRAIVGALATATSNSTDEFQKHLPGANSSLKSLAVSTDLLRWVVTGAERRC